MQKSINIVYKVFIFIGLSILLFAQLNGTAQNLEKEQDESPLAAFFVKPELFQKAGELSFNVVRIRNISDSAVRIKPVLDLPSGWAMFSTSFIDTVVPPHDTISLSFRIRIPARASSDIKHEICFHAYSMHNKLLVESCFFVNTEAFHNWDVVVQQKRVYFYPRQNKARFNILIENKGNTHEVIDLRIEPDKKIDLTSLGEWDFEQDISLAPYQDTILEFNASYTYSEDRIFDISRVQIHASTSDKKIFRAVLAEKYSDTYAPFEIDRNLPHETELGFRTFSENKNFLPFIKARGVSTFKNESSFRYNFTYYDLTETEDFIGNSYYSFLYNWESLNVGLGAFSSQLGRNLYSRHAVMISNVMHLSPSSSLEAYASQSFLTPKTSVAMGYAYDKKKTKLTGSVSYDVDGERDVNTGSILLRSNMIRLTKNQDISANLYGFYEYHYFINNYTLMGYAWDINYYARIGRIFTIQLTNNYGSPNIPGIQMGLLSFRVNTKFYTGNRKKYFSAQYINSSRNFHEYSYTGIKLPNIYLYDQYANILYHSHDNPANTWSAGPSMELYHSRRPSRTIEGEFIEYRTQKLRFEYKAVIARKLLINLKTGLADIYYKETDKINEMRYDLHLSGGYGFNNGYSISFSYDYGPMVNTGLYQYPGDALNHSFNIGPQMTKNYFKDRVSVNLFANLAYRFDLKYGSVNINPRIEAFIFRDWYFIVGGTYSYTQQDYPEFQLQNSHLYLEFSIKKRWGKSDYKKWQKDLHRLKIVLFKDDNGNGIKESFEQGVPYVKTRLKLTNSANKNVSTQFPFDITLLSNEEGIVIYNRIPLGFYDLFITPLSDLKEYFYVNPGIEKIEITKTTTYFIPFQKADKIKGEIVLKRQKFIVEGEETIGLTNIKITAYNKQGNSYSSFTREDGSFVIFVPGDNTYYLRMGNVFGSNFKILKNDISTTITDSTNSRIVFNVVEISRKISFKKATPVLPDSLQQPLKIKVLHGKIYENISEEAVDKDAMPEFDIAVAPPEEQKMKTGKYYVVVGNVSGRKEALAYKKIVQENGINAYVGYDDIADKFYVFTNYYNNRAEARQELDRLKEARLKARWILKYE